MLAGVGGGAGGGGGGGDGADGARQMVPPLGPKASLSQRQFFRPASMSSEVFTER